MFCPVCKTEYRPGLTKCSDCGVDLVSNLPPKEPGADADVPRNAEGLELLWSGMSQALSDRIHEDLDAAHIVHKPSEKDFGLLPALAQRAKFVWIDPRDRASARSILQKILADSGITEQEAELTPPDSGRMNLFGLGRKVYERISDAGGAPFEPASLFGPKAPAEPVPDDTVERFHPDDATSEVWAGDDIEMAQFLKDSLQGVGVGCVVSEDDGKTRVLVLPASEARAREVVREVVEGTPPE
jgi:hypothetical protein